ncbi:MAG: hypothetical protein M0Q41_08145 [Bacteroidales bacterium]|nr:hypothetical protein [Bacteroidales bacterium]
MSVLKRISQFSLLVLLLPLFYSCELDDDFDLDSDDPIAMYLGGWSVSDNATKLNYTVTIRRNPENSTEVLIDNFAGSGDAAKALVTGKTLTLTSITVGNGWRISGYGTYKNSGRIDFWYSLTISGDQEERFALFSR